MKNFKVKSCYFNGHFEYELILEISKGDNIISYNIDIDEVIYRDIIDLCDPNLFVNCDSEVKKND